MTRAASPAARLMAAVDSVTDPDPVGDPELTPSAPSGWKFEARRQPDAPTIFDNLIAHLGYTLAECLRRPIDLKLRRRVRSLRTKSRSHAARDSRGAVRPTAGRALPEADGFRRQCLDVDVVAEPCHPAIREGARRPARRRSADLMEAIAVKDAQGRARLTSARGLVHLRKAGV